MKYINFISYIKLNSEGLLEPRYFINRIYMLMILINDDNEKEIKEINDYLYNNYINFFFQSLIFFLSISYFLLEIKVLYFLLLINY